MKRLNVRLIESICHLRKKGHGYKAIAKMLHLSHSTVYKYAKDVRLSAEAKQRILFSQVKNKKDFVQKFAKEKKIKHPFLDATFASVLGHVLFDGSVPLAKGGKHRINYTSSSEDGLKAFIAKS